MNFLGIPMAAPLGIASLALKTRTPLLPAALVRQGRGFQLLLGEPLQESGGGHDAADRVTAATLSQVEAWVRQHPDEWSGWEHLTSVVESGVA